ncbi:universal stress protein [Comamonas sp. C11]|uniref:universal stress protein n=1 Tax=Comamonas sp. C11 TaxID=2966554 RepID=UPI0021111317|nr:universal stress protein [Comamonas sp. C11]UUC94458.1 universal stress protein [Comamonas sp. C11]
MFKHLLIPTDGSELSEAAAYAGIQLAKEQGAQVTGLYVIPDYAVIYATEGMLSMNVYGELEQSAQIAANSSLEFIKQLAQKESVPCKTVMVTDISTYEAIIKQAQSNNCDLICMASHGRKGIGSLLLGSETQKVLSHSHIPVLVHRPALT